MVFATILVYAGVTCSAQSLSKDEVAKLFLQVAEDEKAVAACKRLKDDYQLKTYGKIRPPISGHCFGGCPTLVVKPYYPTEARRLNISGEVRVDTIVDEKGSVIFAKVTKGNAFLRKPALEAAYRSTYQPKVTCENRPIKFRWAIRFNFYPSM